MTWDIVRIPGWHARGKDMFLSWNFEGLLSGQISVVERKQTYCLAHPTCRVCHKCLPNRRKRLPYSILRSTSTGISSLTTTHQRVLVHLLLWQIKGGSYAKQYIDSSIGIWGNILEQGIQNIKPHIMTYANDALACFPSYSSACTSVSIQ